MDTNANTITTMGIISNEVYNEKYYTDDAIANKIKIEGTNYEVIASTGYSDIDIIGDSSLNGFQALLLKSGTQYVIAFRGTDSLLDGIIDITALPLANYNPQYNSAVEFVNNALAMPGIDKSNLTLTGHSLGGILTKQVGASLGIKGYAYNPWGADALTKYTFNGTLNIVAKVLEAVGIYSSSAEAFAKDNIANISYQDGGDLNGDFLSNLATGLISEHLGDAFIPIWGADIGADGHRMPVLNSAIAHYNEVLTHFSNSFYEELSLAYLSKGSYEKTEAIFNNLGVYQASGLKLNFLIDDSASFIASKAKGDKAVLYALTKLNPFAIEGNLPAYSDIDPTNYSEKYLQDRAQYLYYLLDKANRYDVDPTHTMNHFEDSGLGSDYTLEQTFSRSRILFGGEGYSTLNGGEYGDNSSFLKSYQKAA